MKQRSPKYIKIQQDTVDQDPAPPASKKASGQPGAAPKLSYIHGTNPVANPAGGTSQQAASVANWSGILNDHQGARNLDSFPAKSHGVLEVPEPKTTHVFAACASAFLLEPSHAL